ncbi:UNKNOWN [Stylonychia lemnae]|uniref:Uncharacterized protein n=1 Tax=Stylonychia lemnae TaxID=5949 RepID=A0A078BCZ8_STYLE|nr:UNKNOWN [Stylonychia lemnae]|eukprot:CDW91468.1 UNKNOWN [Stylonychia lemnae]
MLRAMRPQHPNGIQKRNYQHKAQLKTKNQRIAFDPLSLKTKMQAIKARKSTKSGNKFDLEGRNLSSTLANFEWENETTNIVSSASTTASVAYNMFSSCGSPINVDSTFLKHNNHLLQKQKKQLRAKPIINQRLVKKSYYQEQELNDINNFESTIKNIKFKSQSDKRKKLDFKLFMEDQNPQGCDNDVETDEEQVLRDMGNLKTQLFLAIEGYVKKDPVEQIQNLEDNIGGVVHRKPQVKPESKPNKTRQRGYFNSSSSNKQLDISMENYDAEADQSQPDDFSSLYYKSQYIIGIESRDTQQMGMSSGRRNTRTAAINHS